MEVTNVNVKLSPQSGDRLKAFCTMTLDGEFVVRDLKIIEGTNGLFVAMPSRKLTDHCPKCGGKNHLRAGYCNDCGAKLPEDRISDEDAQGKLHADVAHPINSECRGRIQAAILRAYEDELGRAGVGGPGGNGGRREEPAAEEAPPEEPAGEVPEPEKPAAEVPEPEEPGAEAPEPEEPGGREARKDEPAFGEGLL